MLGVGDMDYFPLLVRFLFLIDCGLVLVLHLALMFSWFEPIWMGSVQFLS